MPTHNWKTTTWPGNKVTSMIWRISKEATMLSSMRETPFCKAPLRSIDQLLKELNQPMKLNSMMVKTTIIRSWLSSKESIHLGKLSSIVTPSTFRMLIRELWLRSTARQTARTPHTLRACRRWRPVIWMSSRIMENNMTKHLETTETNSLTTRIRLLLERRRSSRSKLKRSWTIRLQWAWKTLFTRSRFKIWGTSKWKSSGNSELIESWESKTVRIILTKHLLVMLSNAKIKTELTEIKLQTWWTSIQVNSQPWDYLLRKKKLFTTATTKVFSMSI